MIIISDRKMLIPSAERHIGFTGDNLVETRIFVITDKSLFSMEFRIDIQNTKETVITGKKFSDDGETMFITWDITSAIVKNVPVVEIQLRGFDTDSDRVWHSEKECFQVSSSVEADKEITQEQMSEFHVLEQQASKHSNDARTFCEQALEYRNEAQDLAQQSLSDYTQIRENTYTKEETDNRISGIIVQEPGEDATKVMSQKFLTELLINICEGFDYNIVELENKIQTGLNGKANKNDVYTKSEVYTKDEIFTYVNGEVGTMGMGLDERCNQIDAKIGDIDAALDELHNYAQSLIGGEA